MKQAFLQGLAAIALTAGAIGSMSGAAYAADEAFHVVERGETLNGIANRAGVSAKALAEANGLKEPYIVPLGQKLAIPRKSNPASSGKDSLAEANSHLVRPGETLGGIAARAKVPRVLIAEANGLQAPYVLKAGQKLHIPRTRHHAIVGGDTGFSLSMKYGVPWDQIALANNLAPNAPLKAGQNLLIPTMLNPPPTGVSSLVPAPVASPINAPTQASRFGWPVSGPIRRSYATGSDYHDGLDITAPKGTMVRAAAAGTVKFAGNEKEQFGNLVVLDHGDGWFTAYGFLSRVTVKEGAQVAAGERVGLVGNTGRAKGNELHFEVRRDGKPVDPLDELPTAP